ncbi:MAG TPA: mucoidy inhibitor MuiA family protein, partial [Hyphomicrobium sp.]
MRISVAVAGALLSAWTVGTAADEVPAASRVDTVTVFLTGAEVTRTARLNLDEGEHTVVFNDLPAEAVPGSIRVDGKATAKLAIESVDTRRRYVARADQATLQAERKSIEDEVERLRDERGLAQGQQDAAQTQKMLLNNLAELPGRSAEHPSQTTVPPTDWGQILALIASGMTDAQRSALDAEVKKRELDRRIEELEKKLSALAPARVEQTEVKVFVTADAPLEADLTVRYQVRNAAWTPRYDARLATGSKTAPPQLDLTRRAEIKQRTGESWANVAVQLSTTRPTANAAAPELKTVTVDFEPEPKPVMAAPPPPADQAVQRLAARRSPKVAEEMAAGAGAPEPE